MTNNSKVKIFLSNERGMEEDERCRSIQTFNSASYYNPNKSPVGPLYGLNDVSLAGTQSVTRDVKESSFLILLPVVGDISYKDSAGNVSLVNAGEILEVFLTAGMSLEIANLYESELVNYLQFWIMAATIPHARLLVQPFDLVANKNRLIELIPYSGREELTGLSIGQFKGREEALYDLADRRNILFIFVIEGAFEVQGRLLHPRDGLALWELDGPVDMEALSNEAILVVIELKEIYKV